MSNIVTAQVTIEGTRTLLFNHFGDDAIPLEPGERTGVAGNDPEEWRKKYLATREGVLYLDPTQIFGMLRDGAMYQKKGRGSIQPMVVATLEVLDERILLNRTLPAEPLPTDREEPVYLDVRSVKNPASKARNVRYRVAVSPGWQATFSISWDKVIVARDQMKTCVRDGGLLCGLGDGRNIGFGRFQVVSFDVKGD